MKTLLLTEFFASHAHRTARLDVMCTFCGKLAAIAVTFGIVLLIFAATGQPTRAGVARIRLALGAIWFCC